MTIFENDDDDNDYVVNLDDLRMMMIDFMKESVPRWKGFAGSFQNTPGNHKEHLPPIFFFHRHDFFTIVLLPPTLFFHRYNFSFHNSLVWIS